jgi:hypothetical protein
MTKYPFKTAFFSFLIFPGGYLGILFVECLIRISKIGFENFTVWRSTMVQTPPSHGIPEELHFLVAGLNLALFLFAIYYFWKKTKGTGSEVDQVLSILVYLVPAWILFSYASHYYYCEYTWLWQKISDFCEVDTFFHFVLPRFLFL